MRGLWVRLPPLALAQRLSRHGRFGARPRPAIQATTERQQRWPRRHASIFAILSFPTAPLARARSASLAQTIAEDYLQFGILRDAVAELEAREDRTPAAAVRLGVCQFCSAAIGRRSRRCARPTAVRWPTSTSARASSRWATIPRRSSRSRPPRRPATTATTAPWRLPKPIAMRKDSKKALESLDKLSGAVEQTAEYLYQRGATVAALGGNPTEVIALFERAVEADGRHPGACSAWRSKTTAAATTRRPCNSISGRPRRSRPTSAR